MSIANDSRGAWSRLSGYRLMWMIVMFDLPVLEKAERKAATDFRKALLDMGFDMSQFSVYMRFCTSPRQIETYCQKVEALLPAGGKVSLLQLTDKQYERIQTFHGRVRHSQENRSDQFHLF